MSDHAIDALCLTAFGIAFLWFALAFLKWVSK